jgi:hypothetical protein
MSTKITAALLEKQPLDLVAHRLNVSEARADIKSSRAASHKAQFEENVVTHPEMQHHLERARNTGAWLSILPTTATCTILSPGEFSDNLNLRYGLKPTSLPATCDGCNAPFTLSHALDCSVGGLVGQRHNEVLAELAYLASEAFTPSAVRHEPLIDPVNHTSADRGDLLIRGFFENGTDCIIDVSVHDLDAPSYVSKDPPKVLKNLEQVKKRHYLKECQLQRRHFSPFTTSVDGLLGAEAQKILKLLAERLSTKWSKPYSSVRGYVNARISLALAKACYRCLRGSRIPVTKMSQASFQYGPDGEYYMVAFSTAPLT